MESSKYKKEIINKGKEAKYTLPGTNLSFRIQPAGFLDKLPMAEREAYLDNEFEKAEETNQMFCKIIKDAKRKSNTQEHNSIPAGEL